MTDDKLHSLLKLAIKIAVVLVTLSAIIWIVETYTDTINLPGKIISDTER